VRKETSGLHAESARGCLISSYLVFSVTLSTLILRLDGNPQYSASAPDLRLEAAS
jgi:accessory gene regulator protein AgrB